ncbi:tail fiber protein [Escherichia coli]|nr:tail fiber protein [Escherichia coli]
MLYNTGTIAINGNTATGTGTNWTAPASQVRAGQTIIVMSNPVQMFQISSVNSATSMTVTPAASPALSGQKYGILVSDNISVDGLALAMSQLIKEYDENIGAWETFATTSANQNITVTINGTSLSIPALGKLLQKGSNGALPVNQGGTGATNAADARTNLGLGEGSALPVGVPVPWPSATPPTGWLKCNGAPFSAEEYPKLAKAYPKLKLPDLRGEFIRGWDDGRGVDSARLLLSSQAASILEHNHEMHGWTGNPLMARDVGELGTSSVFAVQLSIGDGGILYSWKDGSGTTNDSKRMDRTNHVSSGAGDGSPRNIAFNYIVRAA